MLTGLQLLNCKWNPLEYGLEINTDDISNENISFNISPISEEIAIALSISSTHEDNGEDFLCPLYVYRPNFMIENNNLVVSEEENYFNGSILSDVQKGYMNGFSNQFEPLSISNDDNHRRDIIKNCELTVHLPIPVLVDHEECELNSVMLYSCPKWIEY